MERKKPGMSGASIDRIGGGGPLGGIGKTRSWDRRPIILGPNEMRSVEKVRGYCVFWKKIES